LRQRQEKIKLRQMRRCLIFDYRTRAVRWASLMAVWAMSWLSELRGAPLDQWHWRNPLPQGNALHNVVFLNGAYIALGELGTVLLSSDGTNWVRQPSGTTFNLRDCAYGSGKYVLVGDFGTILTSTDAVSWTPQYASTFFSLYGVTYADGQFVAVGEQAVILTSPDGITWTQRSSGNWKLFDVMHAGGLFVAAGGNTPTANTPRVGVLLTSPDAKVWTIRVLTADSPFFSLAFGAGKYAAIARDNLYSDSVALWTSVNGTNWQTSVVSGLYSESASISHGNGSWLIATANTYEPYSGNGMILTSADLLDWTVVASNVPPVNSVVFGNGRVVSACANGTFLISSNGSSWSSPWPPSSLGPYFRDLEYVNGAFCEVAYDQLSFSADGVLWTNSMALTNTGNFLSITYGKGLYVAGSESRTVWISSDGVNWTNPAPGLSVQPYVGDVAVAYGNGVFVGAAGYAADIITSPDGTNWTAQQLYTNAFGSVYFRDIAFGNGRFVAVSEAAIATSSDGTNWLFDASYHGLQSVACGKGIFVAVGYGVVSTSVDGTNWVHRNDAGLGPLTDVAFGDGFFVVTTGQEYNTDLPPESAIWISTDGEQWSRRSSKTARALFQVTFGNGTFLIGGEGRAILQSEPLVSLAISRRATPELQVSGPVGRFYRIEYLDGMASSNSWDSLATILATNNPTPFLDTGWTNGTQRFYRAVLLP